MPAHHAVTRCVVFIIVFLFLAGNTAFAGSAPVASYISIPAKEVPKSLRELSEITGMGIMFSEQIVGKTMTRPVQGVYTPIRALEIMLEGTGLTFKSTSSRTVAVTKKSDNGNTTPKGLSPNPAQNEPATRSETTPASNTPQPKEYTLPPLVVTSTEAAQARLQNTSGSASVLSGDSLGMSTTTAIQDLGLWVPNAEFSQFRGYPMGFIRGVGAQLPDFYGADSNVAYYLDGIYIENGFGMDMALFDVQRIEVLRGPQGTVSGSSAGGGAVNIVTCSPTDEPEYLVGLEYGSYNKQRLDAVVSGPVVKDKIKSRLAVTHTQQDGWLSNQGPGQDAEDQDFTGVRAKVTLTPSDRMEVRLTGNYYETDTTGPGYKLISDQGSLATDYGAKVPSGFYDFATDAAANDDSSALGFSAVINARLSDTITLNSITGYQKFKRDLTFDHDASQLDFLVNDESIEVSQRSQQIQLYGVQGPWTWMTGLFFNSQKASDYLIQKLDGIYFDMPGQTFVFQGPFDVETQTFAAYANTRYAVTKRLGLEAGLRWNNDTKKASACPEADPGTITLSSFDEEKKLQRFLPKFAVDYRVAPDALWYATVARSSRLGYLQFSNTLYGQDPGLDPQDIWSYESGLKTQWFDHRLMANLAVFYIDYKNLQIDTSTGSAILSGNAPKAEVKGVELEIRARPLPRLSLFAAASYLDSEFTDYGNAVNPLYTSSSSGVSGTISTTGNRLPFTPKFKFCFGTQYIIALSQWGFVALAGNVTWRDKFYFDHYQSEATSQDAYTIVNAQIRYETRDGRWAADLYGKNLTNEKYYTYKFMELDSTNIVASMGAPRMFGVRLTYRF
ncbi:TonB-dependent receptor [uncultured Desulfobacter sp.]|uniref:TonB-dependent receptor n=1 Tax=uncultured Desulfobacter sp. TaxID=240139 RepID=UPI002AAAB964|nr:TonB-dependent receptor [uncultured Desulfobacter sp.]